MIAPTRHIEIAQVLTRLEDCLVHLDALGCVCAAARLDHAIEELRSSERFSLAYQPKQDRPA